MESLGRTFKVRLEFPVPGAGPGGHDSGVEVGILQGHGGEVLLEVYRLHSGGGVLAAPAHRQAGVVTASVAQCRPYCVVLRIVPILPTAWGTRPLLSPINIITPCPLVTIPYCL